MARIPMTADVAELIGYAAEKIENRSLLLDKFVFHKRWPYAEDSRRNPIKWDEASRWSFIRIADGASQILNREAYDKRRQARGQNREPENSERLANEAEIAETLARVAWDSKEIEALRARHTRRFISLFRTACGDKSSITIGQLEGRLAINLSDSLIQNAGICLDRLFGLPFIPGSAIKGACRHAALEELKAAKADKRSELFDVFRAVFGTADNDYSQGNLASFIPLLPGHSENQKGAIAFLPAYPINEAKLVVDLTNVHYPDYYQSGQIEDLANEKPRPNPFPCVEVGAQFAFCLVLNGINPDIRLLENARHWLDTALTIQGLGAKTASGYGWFSLKPEVLTTIDEEERREAEKIKLKAQEEAAAQKKAEAEVQRRAALSPDEQAAESLAQLNDEAFAQFAKELAGKTEPEQRAFFILLRDKKRDRWKTWKKKKPEMAKIIEEIRAKLKLPALP